MNIKTFSQYMAECRIAAKFTIGAEGENVVFLQDFQKKHAFFLFFEFILLPLHFQHVCRPKTSLFVTEFYIKPLNL
ncbi:MAG: hypothetical protein Q4D23_05895 [Bacteroidales bacterium]|nr:hypothetical protein [Bacteroidales bacterium]